MVVLTILSNTRISFLRFRQIFVKFPISSETSQRFQILKTTPLELPINNKLPRCSWFTSWKSLSLRTSFIKKNFQRSERDSSIDRSLIHFQESDRNPPGRGSAASGVSFVPNYAYRIGPMIFDGRVEIIGPAAAAAWRQKVDGALAKSSERVRERLGAASRAAFFSRMRVWTRSQGRV